MAGCFGNHPVDKWMEQQLYNHLNSQYEPEKYSCECGYEADIQECLFDADEDYIYCPKCQTKMEISE